MESYRADQRSRFGALGFTSVEAAGSLDDCEKRRLVLRAKLVPRENNRSQGEVLRTLEDLPGIKYPVDLVGASISAKIDFPPGMVGRGLAGRLSKPGPPAGVQIILESENPDGFIARQYGPWTEILAAGPRQVVMTVHPLSFQGYTSAGFDPERVINIGMKVGLNSQAFSGYTGPISVKSLAVDFPSTARREQIRSAVAKLAGASENLVLSRLPALTAHANLPLFSFSGTISKVSNIASFRRLPSGQSPAAWELDVKFDAYRADAWSRSARLEFRLAAPTDLTRKKLLLWVAVGPRLRGVMTRPNQCQIELYDAKGRVLRGPAASVSSAIAFSYKNRKYQQHASKWVKLEAAYDPEVPLSMGFATPGFAIDDVRRIGIRFEVGKASNVFRSYPMSGTLLMSDLYVEPFSPSSQIHRLPVARTPTVARPPVPVEQFLVGINYAFINYGWDVGQNPYGKRARGGFSSHVDKLRHDFALFSRKGIQAVRVFILGDLRTGITYAADGSIAGIDPYVSMDLDALVTAATTARLKLIPVLVDFLAADGEAAADYGLPSLQWRMGEAADGITDPNQRALLIKSVLTPIVRQLAAAQQNYPGIIYALDITNEIENAKAIVTPRHFAAVKAFVRELRDMIRSVAPELPVTLGSRDRTDLINYWSDLDLDVWQYHYYDKAQEEENRPLHFAAQSLGFSKGRIVLGEVEPSDIESKLDVIHGDGYDGALFWSHRGLDGYQVDLDAIERWVKRRRARTSP